MNRQQQQTKLELIHHIDEFVQKLDGDFGYLPENVSEAMADAAFSVLMAIKGTNDYLTENPLS